MPKLNYYVLVDYLHRGKKCTPPPSVVSLSVVSAHSRLIVVNHSHRPQSEEIKWEITETVHRFEIKLHSEIELRSHLILLCPT